MVVVAVVVVARFMSAGSRQPKVEQHLLKQVIKLTLVTVSSKHLV